MGYYTRYEVTSINEAGYTGSIELDEWENTYLPALIDIVGYDPTGDPCKWYDNEDDMISLSSRFPEVIFRIYGEGEIGGDIWHSYYKNGKQIFSAITEFNLAYPDLLKYNKPNG